MAFNPEALNKLFEDKGHEVLDKLTEVIHSYAEEGYDVEDCYVMASTFSDEPPSPETPPGQRYFFCTRVPGNGYVCGWAS